MIVPESKDSLQEDIAPEYTIREAGANDAKAICNLFSKIFKEEMSPEHWHWKYDRDQSRGIVVYREDRLVAHYGGVGIGILAERKKAAAIQITDLMVDPAFRHGIRTRSPFYLSAKQFLEKYAGFDKPFLYAFGFPSERAMKLSERLGLYAPVGRMWEMNWTLKPSDVAKFKVEELDTESFARAATRIDSLWQRFSSKFAGHFITIKNADYFRWRYLEHPSRDYSIYLIPGKWFRPPEALLVIRHDKKKSVLMDVLTTNPDYRGLIAKAKALAAAHGSKRLLTWCTDVFREDFEHEGAEARPLPIIIPANTCSNGPPPEIQRGKWWLMPGDTDYL